VSRILLAHVIFVIVIFGDTWRCIEIIPTSLTLALSAIHRGVFTEALCVFRAQATLADAQESFGQTIDCVTVSCVV